VNGTAPVRQEELALARLRAALVLPPKELETPADPWHPAPSRAQRPAADSGGRRGAWRHSYLFGLVLVLTVQAALALRLVWSNTAFQDEAEYLWYGHMEWTHWLRGTPLPTDYLSGSQVMYPPLGALADSAGGLAGARLLSLAFMLGATALCYATGSRLFSRRAGLIAAAMFAAVGPAADMGAWATYDPMAIFLTALAAWLAIRATRSRVPEIWIICAAIAMVAADATKWAAALWDPVIVALVVLTAPTGWSLAVARGARIVSYAVALAAPGLFVLGGLVYVVEITGSTVQRGSGGGGGTGTSVLSVLGTAAPLVAAVLVLALLAVVLAWRERVVRRTLICCALVVATVLAPAAQAYQHASVSIYKHVVFGAWFGAMAAGYALSKAELVNTRRGWRVGLAAAIFASLLGLGQASALYGFWPDTAPMIAALQRHLPARGTILMEDGDQMVTYYYLLHGYSIYHKAPIIVSSYTIPPNVISQLVESHQLGMIETDTGTGIPPSSIQESIAGNPRQLEQAGYRQVARIPWRDPDGAVGWFTIWQLAPGIK
jgi:hypothetical protein